MRHFAKLFQPLERQYGWRRKKPRKMPPAGVEADGQLPAQRGKRKPKGGLVRMARRLMVAQDQEVRISYYKRVSLFLLSSLSFDHYLYLHFPPCSNRLHSGPPYRPQRPAHTIECCSQFTSTRSSATSLIWPGGTLGTRVDRGSR